MSLKKWHWLLDIGECRTSQLNSGMDNQDFSAPFPSWGQFFLFNIIFFLGLSSLSLYFVSLFSNGFIGIEKTIIMSSLFVLPLFFVSALSFNGIKLSNYNSSFYFYMSLHFSDSFRK